MESASQSESAPPDDVLAAFPGASRQSPGLRRLLETAAELSTHDARARELVIDMDALIGAALKIGSSTRSNLNSARWLHEALQPAAEYFKRDLSLGEKRAFSRARVAAEGYRLVASRTLHSSVLPRAREFSRQTIGNEEYAQRHLLMALLFLPANKWPDLGRPVDEALLESARRHLVEAIGRNPEKGESMDAWRTIAGLAPSESEFNEHLRAQRDDPAEQDRLGRKYFAEVVADRIREVRASQERGWTKRAKDGVDRAFMVHLDGAWGAGKSSVLNFIEREIKQVEGRASEWLVVRFNAWRSHHLEPPWWAIIRQIVAQAGPQLDGLRWTRFRGVWFWWKLRNDYAWLVFALILIFVGLALLIFGPALLAALPDQSLLGQVARNFRGFVGDGSTLTGIVGIVTTIGGLAGLGRAILFGSTSAAQKMEALRDDPLTPAMDLFADLVAAADRPILVIIDDIDRCRADYVVDLLEGVQTLLREAPITYLVAGDRHWITTSFEKRYELFRPNLALPARPLGHLFLDKVFQLSVSIPEVSAETRDAFWQGVLRERDSETASAEEVEARRAEARTIVAAERTEQGMQRAREAASDPALKQAIVVESARRAASAEFASSLESRYAKYGHLLDSNPRAIKRLVNKLGMNQSMMLLAKREIAPGALARWTAIELRWPLLADRLRSDPALLSRKAAADDPLAALLKGEAARVIGRGADDRLDAAALRNILGIIAPTRALGTAPTTRS